MQTRSVQSMAEFVAHEWAESIVSDVFPNDADKVVSGRFSWQLLRMCFVINTNPKVVGSVAAEGTGTKPVAERTDLLRRCRQAGRELSRNVNHRPLR